MKKAIYFILLIMWMLVIFCFSSANADVSGGQSMSLTEKLIGLLGMNLPENTVNIIETIIRKIAHFGEYTVLGVLSVLYASSAIPHKKWSWIYALVFCVMYAVSDEIHQYFVPGRACSMFDICVDTSGSLAGIYLLFFTKKIIRKIRLINQKTTS